MEAGWECDSGVSGEIRGAAAVCPAGNVISSAHNLHRTEAGDPQRPPERVCGMRRRQDHSCSDSESPSGADGEVQQVLLYVWVESLRGASRKPQGEAWDTKLTER